MPDNASQIQDLQNKINQAMTQLYTPAYFNNASSTGQPPKSALSDYINSLQSQITSLQVPVTTDVPALQTQAQALTDQYNSAVSGYQNGHFGGQSPAQFKDYLDGLNSKINSINSTIASAQTNQASTAQSSIPDIQAKLGTDLTSQENQAYTAMVPQIAARLNALGLSDSSQVGIQDSQYKAKLDSARQSALDNFSTTQNAAITAYPGSGQSYADLQKSISDASQKALSGFTGQYLDSSGNPSRQSYLAGIGSKAPIPGTSTGSPITGGFGVAGSLSTLFSGNESPATDPVSNYNNTRGLDPSMMALYNKRGQNPAQGGARQFSFLQ